MFLGSKIDNSKITFATESKQTKFKREVKLFGITIDEKLTFTKHTANTCSLANNRLRALARIRRFLSTSLSTFLSARYRKSSNKRPPSFKRLPPISGPPKSERVYERLSLLNTPF